jgi:hypothetical protein
VRVKEVSTRPAPASIRQFLQRIVRGHGPAIPLQRREIPYWQERGWTRKGNTYNGNYQTAYGAFWGQIIERRGGHIDFMLYTPSNEIRNCGHWPCFQHRGNDWFVVHMAKQPKDVSSGIIAIERLITEAYEQ